jgi:predicted unusual protein kinase regulating ubiquinone biosynthesis (AarF/ABC1/UbiB family)
VLRMMLLAMKSPMCAQLFAKFDWQSMASTSVAQLHKAQLPDGRTVAVKVQHRNAQRMMLGDLRLLRLLTGLLHHLHVDVGFDLHSIVCECCVQVRRTLCRTALACSFLFAPTSPTRATPFPTPTVAQVQVPQEFDFQGTPAAAAHIAASLARAALTDASLRDFTIPVHIPHLCTRRILTMEFLCAIPLAHAVCLPRATRKHLCTVLVKAYGYMILRDGVFHSEPHPGNLVVLSRDGSSLQLGLLDFGQCKVLSTAMRCAYARLVIALASRDSAAIRGEMQLAGIAVERCSAAFQAAAAVIMFDTRADFPEATVSPANPAVHEFRCEHATCSLFRSSLLLHALHRCCVMQTRATTRPQPTTSCAGEQM